MINNATHLEYLNSPVRNIQATVGMYENTSLLAEYTNNDYLKSFTVERVGESKFFGFGICQKCNVKLIDVNREKNFTTSTYIKFKLGTADSKIQVYSYRFRIHECHRNEITNELSITAYDEIYETGIHTIDELKLKDNFTEGYTLNHLANHIAKNFLGLNGLRLLNISDNLFSTYYTHVQVNFEGTETIREMLNDIAEVTQTIYYISTDGYLVFKRLDKNGDAKLTIDKSKYIELSSKTNRRLAKIMKTTSLGDNVDISIEATGTTQYIKDNGFYELRSDIADLLAPAATSMLGMTINQFDCSWRGNYLLEPGDKIDLITKDNETASSFILDDTASYDGTYSHKTAWKYEDTEDIDASNPSTIGEAITRTVAIVNKVDKQIDLIVSDVNDSVEQVAQLQLKQDVINASVRQNTESIDNLSQEVAAKITSEELAIEINKVKEEIGDIDNDEVVTKTGYRFDATGLTVEKSGSQMKTQITEDGMAVYRGGSEVLRADNEGVKAEDLHATTYLLIGSNSRLEDYGSNRTGCFWIGQ